MDDKTIHKYLVYGIIAGVSLTTFLFGYTNADIRELREDRDIDTEHILEMKQDVGYIKGVIQGWQDEGTPEYIPRETIP